MIHGPVRPGHYLQNLMDELERHPQVRTVEVPLDRPLAVDTRHHDASIVFVPLRTLDAQAPIEWRGDGRRVVYDHDAHFHLSTMATKAFVGRVSGIYNKHRFDLAAVSGRYVAERLGEDGVASAWVPKGFDPTVFRDLRRPRHGVCHFGQRYPARRAMLRRTHARIQHIDVPFLDLNETLNTFSAGVVCTMQGVVKFGRLGRAVERARPGALVRVEPGVEPMIKNFEMAGSGCAPIMDRTADLEHLGFADGVNYLGYDTFDELDAVLMTSPESLEKIGQRASEHVHRAHTWRHRVAALLELSRS